MAGSAYAVIHGILSDDPSAIVSKSGTKIVKVRLGWSRKQGGENKWANIDVTVFGATAERVEEYAKKGDYITVNGELQQEEWVDKNTGQNRYKISLVASNVQFGGKRDQGNEKPAQQKKTEKAKPKKDEEFPESSDDDFGDVPF